MRQFASRLLYAVLFILFSQGAQALTPSEALDYEHIGSLHFSPDGTKLVYVLQSYPKDVAPRLVVMDLATGTATEITPAGKSERSPLWTRDGQKLAFLSNRAGKNQIFALPRDGGTPVALTSVKSGVKAFGWSPDGHAIAYLAKDDSLPDNADGPQVADDPAELPRLWVLDLATNKAHMVGRPGMRIDEFVWQDASHLLIVASDQPRVEAFNTAVYRVAITGSEITLLSHPPQPFEDLNISPDGKQYTVRATNTQGPVARDLFVGTVGKDDLKGVSVPIDRAVIETRWHGDAIWLRCADGFTNKIYRIAPGSVHGENLALSAGSFDVAADGRLAFVGEDFAHPAEIYLRDRDGSIRQLTHLQKPRPLAPVTIFHVKSFDGRDIEAALMRPQNAAPTQKLPLVLLVHGGPSGYFTAGYGWEIAWGQMLASHGYQVLLVNPRGSNGYDEDFLKANRGDWGGGDYKDLMAALDAVIARGCTDANRLGIGGWSYGGEMSAWAIGQTGRFNAAVVGAGVFDQAAEFETEDDPSGDEWYFGTPWEHPDVFARNSPSTFIRNAHTPALIFDGTDDASNPVGQSKGLYRALKYFGVETQLVLYPGEGHSPRKGSFNIDMFTRILDWYDRHLKS